MQSVCRGHTDKDQLASPYTKHYRRTDHRYKQYIHRTNNLVKSIKIIEQAVTMLQKSDFLLTFTSKLLIPFAKNILLFITSTATKLSKLMTTKLVSQSQHPLSIKIPIKQINRGKQYMFYCLSRSSTEKRPVWILIMAVMQQKDTEVNEGNTSKLSTATWSCIKNESDTGKKCNIYPQICNKRNIRTCTNYYKIYPIKPNVRTLVNWATPLLWYIYIISFYILQITLTPRLWYNIACAWLET